MFQLPLNLQISKNTIKHDLIKGEYNKEAINFLFEKFIDSSENIILLCGPNKVGKTFLSQTYIKDIKGIEINFNDISSLDKAENLVKHNKVYLLENICSINNIYENYLFTFYNLIQGSKSKLILTSRYSPSEIKFSLPDLRSRILNSRFISIKEPEEDTAKLVIFKMFHDKQIRVNPTIINYILHRVERKALSFYEVINKIEQEIFIRKQKLTINLVRSIINRDKYSP